MNSKVNMAKVSVIVPVYNVAEELKQCIVSLVQQTYHDLEIILVNDGSTDASGKILDVWKEKDNRIKVIHTENGGVTAARKKGWREAHGEYCIFVDGDDCLVAEAISYFIDIFQSGDYDFVSGTYDVVYDSGEVFHVKAPFVGIFDTGNYIRACMMQWQGFPSIWIGMFRTSVLIEKVFDIERKYFRGEDGLMVAAILNNVKNICCTDKIFYLYKQRMSSVTKTTTLSFSYIFDLNMALYKIVNEKYHSLLFPELLKNLCHCYFQIFMETRKYDKERRQLIHTLYSLYNPATWKVRLQIIMMKNIFLTHLFTCSLKVLYKVRKIFSNVQNKK